MSFKTLEQVRFDLVLEKYAEEGRDPQLFSYHGYSIFPVYSVATGGLYAFACVFLISRGEGERAPAYEGTFPTEHHATVELGSGWRVIAMQVRHGATALELEEILANGEKILRAYKSPVS